MENSLSERDKRVIWHPYTPQKYAPDPIPIVKGAGAWIYDDNGKAYLDAISSWWVTVHGHGNSYIAEKIYRQALQLEQVIFAGFTHEPAVQLAERLITRLPGNFDRIFFSDNGSTATEVAIKMALQYWRNRGIERRRILALSNSYHGDTFGAMSISERGLFTDAFGDFLFDVSFADLPHGGPVSIRNCQPEQVSKLLDECACFIYEPLVQGAGGMLMYEPAHLENFLMECRRHDIICIADEVMTGFGRTGRMFASEYCGTPPDMICLSKGLTGGTMAMGITACTPQIHEAFVDQDVRKTFYHGHSYTANPIACAAALASLDIFDRPETMEQIGRISAQHESFTASLRERSRELGISNIRQTGTIVAFDKNVDNPGYSNDIKQRITTLAMRRGVYLRPLGNTVYLMPPYCVTVEELELLYKVTIEVLEELG